MTEKDQIPSTDPTRWRLITNEIGVHYWHYFPETGEQQPARPQTRAEKYFLGLQVDAPILPPPDSFQASAQNGLLFYEALQLDDGHWGCSYGGPSFLLPGMVFAMYITQRPIPQEWRIEMTRWICNHQNDDGGWGLNKDSMSTVNATVLYYVALRILGMEASHSYAVKARQRLSALGGALHAPQWARYWLATLNLFDWDGIQPVPSEMWNLPTWVPIHPSKWWVQCRAVYLPVSYLYSNRCQAPLNQLLTDIRGEIYAQPYESIKFSHWINQVGPLERRKPLSIFLTILNNASWYWGQYLRTTGIHRRGNDAVRDLIRREDENTSYNDIAPVNKAFHMAALHFADGPGSSAMALHHDKVLPYFWMDQYGMNCGGTNGAQVWDTAFSVIGIVEAGLGSEPRFQATLDKAHKFLQASQFEDDVEDPYRQKRKGGWPFSTKDNGYIVSDCAGEGLKATLLLQEHLNFDKLIPFKRLQDCVQTLLLMQNPDGGFGSYERVRTSTLVEMLNPAELFDRCMVEYSYPECTCAVISALALFQKYYPDHFAKEIETTTRSASKFIEQAQRIDGSWYGSWAVCFTYGTMFGIEGLVAAGYTYTTSESIRRACAFLIDKQRNDGGWGERWESCERREWVEHESSQVVNTAWATLALMAAGYPDPIVVSRGLELIRQRQQPNGEWLQEDVEGVFNCTCTIEYPNYKFHFPIRVLGRFHHEYIPALKKKEVMSGEKD